MQSEKQIKVLMLACELEKTIGELYTLFAGQFPDHDKFWLQMAEEEGHANAIRRLYELSYEGRSLFDEGSIKTEALQSILNYVKEQIEAARNKHMTVTQAISLTHDLETSLIEKKIFSHFKVSRELSDVLIMLNRETKSHIQRPRDELDRCSSKG